MKTPTENEAPKRRRIRRIAVPRRIAEARASARARGVVFAVAGDARRRWGEKRAGASRTLRRASCSIRRRVRRGRGRHLRKSADRSAREEQRQRSEAFPGRFRVGFRRARGRRPADARARRRARARVRKAPTRARRAGRGGRAAREQCANQKGSPRSRYLSPASVVRRRRRRSPRTTDPARASRPDDSDDKTAPTAPTTSFSAESEPRGEVPPASRRHRPPYG